MITEALTRPIGPLAAWQWGLVVVGGYVGYRYLTGGGSGGGGTAKTTTDLSQTGSNIVQGPQGEPGPVGPPGLPGTNTTTTITAGLPSKVLGLKAGWNLYDPVTKKVAGKVSAAQNVTVITVKIGGVWRYLITTGPYAGRYLVSGTIQPLTNPAPVTSPVTTASAPLPLSATAPLNTATASISPVSTTVGSTGYKGGSGTTASITNLPTKVA